MASVHQTKVEEPASEAQSDTSIHDGRQLEQSPEEQGDQSEETRKEDKEDSRTDNGTEEATPVNENPPTTSALSKKEERLRRLRELHLRRNEARKLNHAEVVEEDRRNKLPSNWEARKRKIDWELQEEEAKKQAEADGEDYERVKLLETSAVDMEKKDRKKKKKSNPDTGFAGFAAAQERQYDRLTRQFEPDLEAYERQKQEMGETFFPGVNTLLHGTSKVSKAGVDRMVADLEKQIEKRAKYSRRRPHDGETDVDYINERNKKFNKKAARFYDQFTEEIKQNLERGTAV